MWYTLNLEEVRRRLRTNFEKGLTEEEAEKRLQEYGTNELTEKKKSNIFVKFINQFKDFMIIVLIIAAIISAVLSYVEHTNEYIDSIIIIAIVVLNAIMGVIQESKAEKSLEALKKMAEPMCKVKRNGKIVQVSSSKLVPGDIAILETGCYVPADVRLIESYNLKVEESALTGETIAIEKNSKAILDKTAQLGDMVNMAFLATVVVNRTCTSSSCTNRNEHKCGKNCNNDNDR